MYEEFIESLPWLYESIFWLVALAYRVQTAEVRFWHPQIGDRVRQFLAHCQIVRQRYEFLSDCKTQCAEGTLSWLSLLIFLLVVMSLHGPERNSYLCLTIWQWARNYLTRSPIWGCQDRTSAVWTRYACTTSQKIDSYSHSRDSSCTPVQLPLSTIRSPAWVRCFKKFYLQEFSQPT